MSLHCGMPPKSKPKPSKPGGSNEILAVLVRLNEQFHMLLQFLRKVEENNQTRHTELLKAVGNPESPSVRTMVYLRKRREQIPK